MALLELINKNNPNEILYQIHSDTHYQKTDYGFLLTATYGHDKIAKTSVIIDFNGDNGDDFIWIERKNNI